MELTNLYRLRTENYTINTSIENFEKILIKSFNLNKLKENTLSEEYSKYRGIISNNYFEITQNKTLVSENNGLYFFFTQITGYYTEVGRQLTITIHLEINKDFRQMLIVSIIVYFIVLLFHIWIGLTCFILTLLIYLYAKKKTNSDFQIFKQEFQDNFKNKIL